MQTNEEDIRDKYDIGKILGSGSFGQVREAIVKENPSEVRAVKMIERDDDDGEWSNRAIFVREVGLLQQIKHENIIRYFDVYEDVHFLYVVMELCKGGEVFAKILELKRFSERNAATIGKQMLQAMDYMHKLMICHRDIKAENFMLAAPHLQAPVKMIDFGMATKFVQEEVLTELCGSPHYLAPELIGQKYNHLADVWAFGVLMYLLMYGHYPHDAKHPRDIMVKILTEPIEWRKSHSKEHKLSKDAISFLKRVLEHNPQKRMTAEEALNHQWMQGFAKSLDDGEALSTEVLRSAHKKITSTRKMVDQKVDELRNQKLQKIDEDFSRGIRHGQRLGETPTEDFMSKPEFLRRDNKLTTAPSGATAVRRTSITQLIAGHLGGGAKRCGGGGGAKSEDLMAKKPFSTPLESHSEDQITPLTQTLGMATSPRKGPGGSQRSASVSVENKRRLSYLGGISKQEERKLADLFEEKKNPANIVPADPTGSNDGCGGGSGVPLSLLPSFAEEEQAAAYPGAPGGEGASADTKAAPARISLS